MTRPSRPLLFRVLCVGLGGMFLMLQIRLWVSEDGFAEAGRLRTQVDLQDRENRELADRNRRLDADVRDLKKGFSALEERARSDLGLIAPNETFFVFGENAADLRDK